MHSNDEAFLKTPFSYVSSFDIICFSICKILQILFLRRKCSSNPQHISFDLLAFLTSYLYGSKML
uniref:Putative ovule protein n=1 Tax=Solanum chacoense TaxID=4108 RepID=A0A0V0HB82_SOLCH